MYSDATELKRKNNYRSAEEKLLSILDLCRSNCDKQLDRYLTGALFHLGEIYYKSITGTPNQFVITQGG